MTFSINTKYIAAIIQSGVHCIAISFIAINIEHQIFKITRIDIVSIVAVLMTTTIAVTSILSSSLTIHLSLAQSSVTQESKSLANQAGEEAPSAMNNTAGWTINDESNKRGRSIVNEPDWKTLQNINYFNL